jgi:hypothetical protein
MILTAVLVVCALRACYFLGKLVTHMLTRATFVADLTAFVTQWWPAFERTSEYFNDKLAWYAAVFTDTRAYFTGETAWISEQWKIEMKQWIYCDRYGWLARFDRALFVALLFIVAVKLYGRIIKYYGRSGGIAIDLDDITEGLDDNSYAISAAHGVYRDVLAGARIKYDVRAWRARGRTRADDLVLRTYIMHECELVNVRKTDLSRVIDSLIELAWLPSQCEVDAQNVHMLPTGRYNNANLQNAIRYNRWHNSVFMRLWRYVTHGETDRLSPPVYSS